VAHIIAGQLGYPLVLFNEGFATYSSERFGADALQYLALPGKKLMKQLQNILEPQNLSH